jgi:hypothetical protein
VIRRSFRIGLTLALVAGVAFVLAKLLGSRSEGEPVGLAGDDGRPWPPLSPEPTPSAPSAPTARPAAWVEPTGGVCPTSHPEKAKLSSKIFHRPGMANYDRTNPDRCYVDGDAAEADGLRAAKR